MSKRNDAGINIRRRVLGEAHGAGAKTTAKGEYRFCIRPQGVGETVFLDM
jgi:5-methylthioribose kinase